MCLAIGTIKRDWSRILYGEVQKSEYSHNDLGRLQRAIAFELMTDDE